MKKYFSKLHSIESKISKHLLLGGSIDDAVGKYLVTAFVDEFISIPNKTNVCDNVSDILTIKQIRNGLYAKFSLTEMDYIISESIKMNYPKIWINADGPILLATAFFFMPKRMYDIYSVINNEFLLELQDHVNKSEDPTKATNTSIQLTPFRRSELLNAAIKKCSVEIKSEYDSLNGDANLLINKDGGGLSIESAKSDWINVENDKRKTAKMILVYAFAIYGLYVLIFK